MAGAPRGAAAVTPSIRDTRAPVFRGAPDDAISAVAVTADGRAALTSGDLDGARLWPALDGSLEPVVLDVPAARPHGLALAKLPGGGFGIAIIDDAGGLIVERLDGDGRRLSHASFAPEPPVREVVALARGVIARRADHTLVLLDWAGAELARLGAEPGQQLADVAANGTTVVAAERDDTSARVREVTLGDPAHAALAWGATVPHAIAFPAAPASGSNGGPSVEVPVSPIASPALAIAVSPNGTRIAVLVGNGPHGSQVSIVDARGGRELAVAPVAEARSLGFIDDDHVLVRDPAALWIVSTSANPTQRALSTTNPSPSDGDAFATGAGIAVSGFENELALSTADLDTYLGYGVLAPSAVGAGSDDTLVVGVGDGVDTLDASLAPIPARHLDLPNASVDDVTHLAGDDWFVEAHDDRRSHAYLAHPIAHTLTPLSLELQNSMPAEFEPATNLLVLSYTQKPIAMRYDPALHTLAPVELAAAKAGSTAVVTPTNPELAKGSHLVVLTYESVQTATWYGDDAGTAKLAQLAMSSATYLGADRAGQLFAVDNATGKLAMVVTGTQVGTLPYDRGTIAGDWSGKLVAQGGATAMRVYDLAGNVVWEHALPQMSSPIWLADGGIAAVASSGLLRFDATGLLIGQTCGWRFGVTLRPHLQALRGPTVCEAERRSR
jgi:hypothetical protein